MKVGVNILNFGPGVSPDSLARWAQVSENLGYHSLMISDHVAITPSVAERYTEPFYDTFATLAWLAGQTKKVLLGTTVVVLPYRHPILTARLVANIDNFSGGRFIFGVGVGNPVDEFAALGVPHHRRGALANECLEAILALWIEPSPVNYRGRIISFDNVSAIRPAQQPHPPVWVGGSSESAFKRAVRYGDAWHPILRSINWVKETAFPALQAEAERQKRPIPRFSPRIRLDLQDAPVEGERQPGIGNLEQVRSDIVKLERLGADHVILDWYTGDLDATRHHKHGWEMLALLADRVFDLRNERLR